MHDAPVPMSMPMQRSPRGERPRCSVRTYAPTHNKQEQAIPKVQYCVGLPVVRGRATVGCCVSYLCGDFAIDMGRVQREHLAQVILIVHCAQFSANVRGGGRWQCRIIAPRTRNVLKHAQTHIQPPAISILPYRISVCVCACVYLLNCT